MTDSTPALNQLQHWLSQVLISRGDLPQKLITAEQRDGLTLQQCIKSTIQLSAERRVDIYAVGYVMRLLECLKGEFPLVCAFMGEDVFDLFAKAYIVTLPSRSFTLHTLGKSFVDFLTNTQPQGQFDSQRQAMFDIPIELARFERAKAEVLLACGFENSPVENITLNEFELMAKASSIHLTVPPCLRLLETDYDILPLINQLEKSEPHTLPARCTQYTAITRQNYRLIIQPLTHWQADVLCHCHQTTSLEQALAHSAHQLKMDPVVLRTQLALWLPAAVARGLVVIESVKQPTISFE